MSITIKHAYTKEYHEDGGITYNFKNSSQYFSAEDVKSFGEAQIDRAVK